MPNNPDRNPGLRCPNGEDAKPRQNNDDSESNEWEEVFKVASTQQYERAMCGVGDG